MMVIKRPLALHGYMFVNGVIISEILSDGHFRHFNIVDRHVFLDDRITDAKQRTAKRQASQEVCRCFREVVLYYQSLFDTTYSVKLALFFTLCGNKPSLRNIVFIPRIA